MQTEGTSHNNKPEITTRDNEKGIITLNGDLNFRRKNYDQERNRTYFKIQKLCN
jgi:hypothetical protein